MVDGYDLLYGLVTNVYALLREDRSQPIIIFNIMLSKQGSQEEIVNKLKPEIKKKVAKKAWKFI